MGAEPWSYITEYQSDINAVLQALRQEEFNAGRYSGDSEPGKGKGPRHGSIEEAMEDGDADGTASILDIESASLEPDEGSEPPLAGVAYPLPPEKLVALFGTDKPSIEQVEENDDLYDLIGRGCCIYIFTYKNGAEKPSGIYWAGYSYD